MKVAGSLCLSLDRYYKAARVRSCLSGPARRTSAFSFAQSCTPIVINEARSTRCRRPADVIGSRQGLSRRALASPGHCIQYPIIPNGDALAKPIQCKVVNRRHDLIGQGEGTKPRNMLACCAEPSWLQTMCFPRCFLIPILLYVRYNSHRYNRCAFGCKQRAGARSGISSADIQISSGSCPRLLSCTVCVFSSERKEQDVEAEAQTGRSSMQCVQGVYLR